MWFFQKVLCLCDFMERAAFRDFKDVHVGKHFPFVEISEELFGNFLFANPHALLEEREPQIMERPPQPEPFLWAFRSRDVVGDDFHARIVAAFGVAGALL